MSATFRRALIDGLLLLAATLGAASVLTGCVDGVGSVVRTKYNCTVHAQCGDFVLYEHGTLGTTCRSSTAEAEAVGWERWYELPISGWCPATMDAELTCEDTSTPCGVDVGAP